MAARAGAGASRRGRARSGPRAAGSSVGAPSWRYFDPILLVAALALTGYGALMIYSAALPRDATGVVISEPVVRHIASAAAGAVAMFIAARVNYRLLDVLGWFAYGFGIVLLLAVLVVGVEQFGSRRWFDLGFTLVQASEVAKLLTIIGLAKFLTDYRDRLHEPRIFLISLAVAVVPAALVFVEPDAGSSSVFLVLWAVMAAFAGASAKHFLVLGRRAAGAGAGRAGGGGAGLPTRADCVLLRPGVGRAGRRVQCAAGGAGGGVGGLNRQGIHRGHADTTRLPAHADDGLHLQRAGRGAGSGGRDGAVRAVPDPDPPPAAGDHEGAGLVWAAHDRGGS